MAGRTIENISFGPDGIRISYMAETDVRAEGEVFQAHVVAISWANEALRDEVQELDEAANQLVEAAIRVWASTPPADLGLDET